MYVVATSVALLSLGVQCPTDPAPNGSDPFATTNGIAVELIADGLVSPVGMASPGDGTGRLFVLDQIGTVGIIDAADSLKEGFFLDLRDRIIALMPDFDERGLLGLAFHPDYAANGRFFVFYTGPAGPDTPADFDSQTLISEFHVSPDDHDRADPESERVLLTIDKPQFNHNGGQLAFGPDGLLYVFVGDGGGGNDVGVGHTPQLGNGQDKSTLLGKTLRIDVDSGDPYGIPDDNPFLDDPEARPEIWALGLRNPWRASFDSGGDRRLFVGDAGQDFFEEIDVVERGGNYGWNIKEGRQCFDHDAPGEPPQMCPDVGADNEPLIDPIIEYAHFADGEPVGVVVIGGYVYRGSAIPGLEGDYVFGDYSRGFDAPDGQLFAAAENSDGTWVMRVLSIAGNADGRLGSFVLGFGQDDGGEMYVLTTQVIGPSGTTGRVYRIVPPAP
jgi:glucose/arabinose dehydrogenase